MLQVVENLYVDGIERTVDIKQLSEGILKVILLGELEDRLADFLAKPDNGLADEFPGPDARAYHPGGNHPCEQGGSCLVGINPDVIMSLQQGCRAHRSLLSFHDITHSLRLILSPGHHNHLLRAHHCPDTHGDGHLRRILYLTVEVPRLPLPVLVGHHHGPRGALLRTAGIIEADLALLAHAYNEDIHSPGPAVEFPAIFGNPFPWNGAVRNMDVLPEHIHLVDQCIMEAAVAALGSIGRNGIILVDREYLHIAETDLSPLVFGGKPVVQGHRRGSRSKAELEEPVLPGAFAMVVDGLYYDIGDDFASFDGIVEDFSFYLLVCVKNLTGDFLFFQSPVLR